MNGLSKGNWSINKPLYVEGKLFIEPGTTLKFAKDSYLIVQGELVAISNGDKITFTAEEDSWRGIYVLKEKSESYFKNVLISKTHSLSDNLLDLTGAVTFYDSDITIENTIIQDTKAEMLLNIIKSNFQLRNLKIEETFSDGFDSDFSNGVINNSIFRKLRM